MWTKVIDALPEIGQRVKVVGKFTPNPVGGGFLRAVYDGITRHGLSGFRSDDYRAEISITDWCPVDMQYEDEADWAWSAEITQEKQDVIQQNNNHREFRERSGPQVYAAGSCGLQFLGCHE